MLVLCIDVQNIKDFDRTVFCNKNGKVWPFPFFVSVNGSDFSMFFSHFELLDLQKKM